MSSEVMYIWDSICVLITRVYSFLHFMTSQTLKFFYVSFYPPEHKTEWKALWMGKYRDNGATEELISH